MSKILGVHIVVVNMPGGDGGIAAENVFGAPNDGYTWHAQGSALRTYGVMGFHLRPPQDWYVLLATRPIPFSSVKENSPFKSFPDLMEAMKKDPGKIPYGASDPGSYYRVAMEIIRMATGLSGGFVPYGGATASQAGLLSGDVQFILTGAGEQAELLRGKKIRALVTYGDKPCNLKGYGEIMAITDYLPQMRAHLPFASYISLSMCADTRKPILKKIDDAFLKTAQTKSVKEYCERFVTTLVGVAGEEAEKINFKQVCFDSWLMYELGVAKRNPAELNIPKP